MPARSCIDSAVSATSHEERPEATGALVHSDLAATCGDATWGDESLTDIPDEQASPLDALEGEPPSRRGRVIAISSAVVLGVLGLGYGALAYHVADRIPRDATVVGVDVGGLTEAEATQRLTEGLGTRAAAPISVQVGEATTAIDPADAGLTFDVEGTVESLVGFSWDPRVVWDRLFGGGPVEPVTAVDGAELESSLASLVEDVSIPPIEGAITFADGAAVVTSPVPGSQLDVTAASALLTEVWLTGEQPVLLPEVELPPTIDDAAIERATQQIVDPLLSAPVVIEVGSETTELTPDQLAGVASLVPEGADLALRIDGQLVAEIVEAARPEIGSTPRDASFAFVDGRPVIVPAVTGTGLDAAELGDAVAAAAVSADERTAVASFAESEPEFSTADAEALGIVEVIGEFSTPLPGAADPPRTANIARGAELVTGVLLRPGETFSLVDTIGPIDGSNGYNPSGVVVDGFVSEAYGGGLSQLSTTVFNAAFEAGLEDTAHTPHSRWFSRYPEGREATVFEGQIDMKFTNRSEYGVLVQAWVAEGRTWARVWGTDTFDVSIVTGSRYGFTSPRTIYNTSSSCTPESGGQQGFSVNVTRTVSAGGSLVEERTYSTTYQPWNRVVCGPEPAAEPAGGG